MLLENRESAAAVNASVKDDSLSAVVNSLDAISKHLESLEVQVRQRS